MTTYMDAPTIVEPATASPRPSNEAVKILEDAILVLLDVGWIQGQYVKLDACPSSGLLGPVGFCLSGALTAAANMPSCAALMSPIGPDLNFMSRTSPYFYLARDTVQEHIARITDYEFVYIPHWNDQPSRTKDEVIEVLLGSIADLQAKEELCQE